MNRIQCIRHSLDALAGLPAARGAGKQVTGDRRAAMRRAGDLAVADRRPFGVVVVLAAPLLFAGTAKVAQPATRRLLPSIRRTIIRGATQVLSSMAQAPHLTEPGRESPDP